MEHFDNFEEKSEEEIFDAKVDHIRIVAQYSDQKELLIVTVVEAGGEMDVAECKEAQVRIALLSDKVLRKRTEFTSGPVFKFAKTFAFKMDRDKLPDIVVRLRLYRKKMPVARNQMVGECFLKGKKVDTQAVHLLKLRPPIMHSKKPVELVTMVQNGDIIAQRLTTDLQSTFISTPMKTLPVSPKPNPSLLRKITAAHGSEVLISLAYSEDHDTFRIGIEKTSVLERLRDDDGKCVDCYFQIIVRSDGAELCRHRTKIINGENQSNVDEFVAVPATLKELHDLTVIIGLFCISGFLKRRALLGWIRMGADEVENADAAEHWMEMIHDMGRTTERWHNLKRPKNMTL